MSGNRLSAITCSRKSVYAARLPAQQYAVSGTMVDCSRPLVPGWAKQKAAKPKGMI
jgi:hypothetical protein